MSRSSSPEPVLRDSIGTINSLELEDQTALLPKNSDESRKARPTTTTWFGSCIRCGSLLISFLSLCLRTRSTKKRRYCGRRVFRNTFLLIGAFVLISALEALFCPSYQTPPEHYHDLRRAILNSTQPGRGNRKGEKIFIAANIVNEDLIRGAWGKAVLDLVHILGEENVFVSIYENDSGVGTQNALQELQAKLPCNSSIVTGGHISLSEVPTISLPSGEQRTKRIAYLAEVRNRALRPLDRSYVPSDNQTGFRHVSMKFDRVLFLNDIFFSAIDATHLLFSTNNSKYRAACAIDFVSNVMFYDSFVVRDTDGYGMGLMFFPWFPPTGSAKSRNAVLAGKDAVPVRSCWGGMAAFDATVFQSTSIRNSSSLVTRFRYEPEPFWEAAECCLIFADVEDAFGEPDLEQGTSVFVNPFVRVSYTKHTWDWLPFFQRYERIFRNLQYIVSKIGYPEYNPRRLDGSGQLVKQKVWVNTDDGAVTGGSFRMVERRATPGGFCGQRRMFLMKRDIELANRRGDKNWEKIPVPW
ncbi:hypothetical protein PRK78_006491 [Emydomyces testavorans]|uniref:Glycosyltransferase family 69 protein n=1 Tax=Emydomyces testavorans TaxID=2070801 RepID=A0AAF0ILQ2_9EURO|nr:hypothetical protein PRK78_006491 [Emydomyces testavorans]